MSEENGQDVTEDLEVKTLSDFLESTPPNSLSYISDLSKYKLITGSLQDILNTPDIQLHCPSDVCNGIRFFRCISSKEVQLSTSYRNIYVTYRCSNCQEYQKIYALAARLYKEGQPVGVLLKFGERPTFGPPTPARLIKLIGPDRDSFLKERRCENQGLGIGAFVYYRRVVENQKNRILEEIIKVSEKIGASQEKIETLKAAVSETQFSKALDMAKDVIPESLLINGHSPILLLHRALSEGVHALSDEDCLELASSVRIVLGELSERLSQALKDEAELSKALSTLMNQKKG
jgi:hypothetical protein